VCAIHGNFLYLQNAAIHHTHPPRLQAMARLVEHGHYQVPMLTVDASEFRKAYPSAMADIFHSGKVHLYIRQFNTLNAGHVLGDDVWPLWQGLYNFELEQDWDNQVIIEDAGGLVFEAPPVHFGAGKEAMGGGGGAEDVTAEAGRSGGTLAYTSIFGTVSKNHVRGRRSYRKEAVCFRTLITGWGYYGYGSGTSEFLKERTPIWGRSGVMRRWRKFALGNYNLPHALPTPSQHGGFEMIIVVKHRSANHPSFISNPTQVAAAVTAVYPAARVKVVCWADILPFEQQLRILASTHVMLSLPGSDIMNAIFLLDGALLLIPCRKVHPAMNSRLARDNVFEPQCEEGVLWLSHLPFLHSVEYCSHSEDAVQSYDTTTRRTATGLGEVVVEAEERVGGTGIGVMDDDGAESPRLRKEGGGARAEVPERVQGGHRGHTYCLDPSPVIAYIASWLISVVDDDLCASTIALPE
jgi:hypothetical protein